MKIKLIKKINDSEIIKLIELDKNLVDKYGVSFSNEVWNKDNFNYELPDKEKLSYACFVNNELIGYIVSSIKNDSIYIHRFAVDKQGYARLFFEEILKFYSDEKIFLMVNIINEKAISFYKSFNFHIVDNSLIIDKFIADGLKIKNTEILIGENYKCYLMKRD